MRTPTSWLRAFVLVSTVLCASEQIARADVLPPENAACSGAKAGQSCTNPQSGAAGTCQASKCDQKDYANWDRDASVGPPTIQVDCMTCTAGGGSTTTDGGDSGDSGDSGGCSASGAARGAAPWLLAFAAAFLVSARRKRSAS